MGLLAEWTALTECHSMPKITHLLKFLVRHMRPCTDTLQTHRLNSSEPPLQCFLSIQRVLHS